MIYALLIYWIATYVVISPFAYYMPEHSHLWLSLVPVAIFYGTFIAGMVGALRRRSWVEEVEFSLWMEPQKAMKRWVDLKRSQIHNKYFNRKKRK